MHSWNFTFFFCCSSFHCQEDKLFLSRAADCFFHSENCCGRNSKRSSSCMCSSPPLHTSLIWITAFTMFVSYSSAKVQKCVQRGNCLACYAKRRGIGPFLNLIKSFSAVRPVQILLFKGLKTLVALEHSCSVYLRFTLHFQLL